MNILGLMSGSSLDGLDIALCSFTPNTDGYYSYELIHCDEVAFPDYISRDLRKLTDLSAVELLEFEARFSKFLGQCCNTFRSKHDLQIDLIASHGHTVFHFPEKGFTRQLGNGGTISQVAQCDVVCDFRSSDIAVNGQGAPFAPIADALLFPHIDIMVNLGGICNISFKGKQKITALDVCPANQLLNYCSSMLGLAYDNKGEHARNGIIDHGLLDQLKNTNSFTSLTPRGMDNSWVTENFVPLLENVSPKNGLRTIVEFIKDEISKSITLFNRRGDENKSMMITGGGALNDFLMEEIEKSLPGIKLLRAKRVLINFKEALMIAFMGYLRFHRIINVLRTYTGAVRDTIGGCIYAY